MGESCRTLPMKRPAKPQLYVLCDMEGASGISPANAEALRHGSKLWHAEGRPCITSDRRAVCEAANAFGVDEIIVNDAHDNGKREPNILAHELPDNVRIVRRPCLPGKPRHMAGAGLLGIVIVGQHARYGGGGFAPHTIQSPPIGEVPLNGIAVGEIGLELALFMDTPLLAVVGDQAAADEAVALCPRTVGIPVKSLERSWFPGTSEVYPVIREGVFDALHRRDEALGLHLEPPYRFALKPAAGYAFDPGKSFFLRWLSMLILGLCAGHVTRSEASWHTGSIIRALYALHSARGFLTKAA